MFGGESWAYVGIDAECPEPGDWKRTSIGERPVFVLRGHDGFARVFENRCAHRGVQICRASRGRATELVCPYHQWTYDLRGRLIGVPFRRGLRGKGGMPPDFKLESKRPTVSNWRLKANRFAETLYLPERIVEF